MSYGIIGLIDAIEKFEPARGCRFEAYASRRIRGAILDELRSLDWAPRRIRAQARALQQVQSRLENELRRPPSDIELAAGLGVHTAQLELIRTQIELARVRSIDEPLAIDDGGHANVATLGDVIVDPIDSIGRVDTTDSLAQAITALSPRERLVIALYFDKQLTLAHIGTLLGITESRVCQIRTAAISKLRVQFRAAELGEATPQPFPARRGDAA